MYPSLGSILTKMYSICFPIPYYKLLSEKKQKELHAFQRRIQRIEKTNNFPNLKIKEFIEIGFRNIIHLFEEREVYDYFIDIMHSVLLGYSRHFIFNTPTFQDEIGTKTYLLKRYMTLVPELCNNLYDHFDYLHAPIRLDRWWYIPHHGNCNEPFANAFSWAIKIDEHSIYKIAQDASSYLNTDQDSIEKRITRWCRGENIPESIHDCIDVLGFNNTTMQTRIILYFSIILSTYYSYLPKGFDIQTTLQLINRFGKDEYIKSITPVYPSELIDVIDEFVELLKKSRKADNTILIQLENLEKNRKEVIEKYKMHFLLNTIRARYYLHTMNDYAKATNFYEIAFEEGKYRAGRFQKQLSNEYLHCLCSLGDKVAFKRVYFWLRLYSNFLAEPITIIERDIETVFNHYKSNKDQYLYHLEDGKMVFQP